MNMNEKELAKQSSMETQLYPGTEDDEDSYDDMEVQQASMTRVPGKESRAGGLTRHGNAMDVDGETGPPIGPEVGKKLSEKTTRRVILLVLVMMLVLPFLKAGPQGSLKELLGEIERARKSRKRLGRAVERCRTSL